MATAGPAAQGTACRLRGPAVNDLITRLRLRQAFGRLVRRMDDRGVFVLLDPRMPSRMVSAFPEGVEVRRLTLDQAIDCVREHVRENA